MRPSMLRPSYEYARLALRFLKVSQKNKELEDQIKGMHIDIFNLLVEKDARELSLSLATEDLNKLKNDFVKICSDNSAMSNRYRLLTNKRIEGDLNASS